MYGYVLGVWEDGPCREAEAPYIRGDIHYAREADKQTHEAENNHARAQGQNKQVRGTE